MRLGLIILFFLLLQFAGFCQKIFRDGYVVKNNGDTLNGMIKFEANQKVNKKCIFKRFDIASVVMYSPEMLKGFGYKNGNCYESFSVENEVVFLECLLKGSVSLYSDGKRLLIYTLSDSFVVLKNKDVYSVDGDKIKSISEYLIELKGSSTIVNVPNEVKALEEEVLPIVKELNSVYSTNYIVYNRDYNDEMFEEATMLTGSNMSSFGVISALNYSNSFVIYQKNYHFTYVPDLSYSNVDWTFGLFYNYKFSRMNTNLSFQSELFFQRQNSYIYGMMRRIYPSQTFRMDLFTDATIFRIPLFIRYNYQIRNIEPFVNLGLILNYSIYNYRKAILEAESNSSVIYTYGSKDFGKKINYISFFGFAGLGLKCKVLNNKYLIVEGRYLIGQGNDYSIGFDSHYAPKVNLEQNKPKFQIVLGIGI